jgi:hypothetical protein
MSLKFLTRANTHNCVSSRKRSYFPENLDVFQYVGGHRDIAFYTMNGRTFFAKGFNSRYVFEREMRVYSLVHSNYPDCGWLPRFVKAFIIDGLGETVDFSDDFDGIGCDDVSEEVSEDDADEISIDNKFIILTESAHYSVKDFIMEIQDSQRLVDKMDLNFWLRIWMECAEIVYNLKNIGIIYSDIKEDNFLVQIVDGVPQIMICDFDGVCFTDDEEFPLIPFKCSGISESCRPPEYDIDYTDEKAHEHFRSLDSRGQSYALCKLIQNCVHQTLSLDETEIFDAIICDFLQEDPDQRFSLEDMIENATDLVNEMLLDWKSPSFREMLVH